MRRFLQSKAKGVSSGNFAHSSSAGSKGRPVEPNERSPAFRIRKQTRSLASGRPHTPGTDRLRPRKSDRKRMVGRDRRLAGPTRVGERGRRRSATCERRTVTCRGRRPVPWRGCQAGRRSTWPNVGRRSASGRRSYCRLYVRNEFRHPGAANIFTKLQPAVSVGCPAAQARRFPDVITEV